MAVDPGFATNGFIFVYWTRKVDPACPSNAAGIPQNRVSRFTLRRDNTISPTSEVVLADNIPSLHGAHSAGDLRVAADGLLYVTVGDGGCQVGDPTRCASLNLNARRLHLPLGKVLRLTRTGGIPATNPYASAAGSRHCTRATGGVPTGTGPCKEIFATGLRNPFRFALRPGTSEFWVNDVGQGLWEEVNVLRRGADYGWNTCEGAHRTGTSEPCPLAQATAPLVEYAHSTGCTAITGGAFVPGSVWGTAMTGSYLFADYTCGKIFERTADGTVRPFLTDLGTSSAVSMTFGPYAGGQALYYTSYAGGGAIHRVVRTTVNSAPVAAFTAGPAGTAARTLRMDGSTSYDPDGGDRVVRYRWSFGDGTFATTSRPVVQHQYATSGPATVTLRVVDTRGAVSAPTTRTVTVGNQPPAVTILGADPAHRYWAGDRPTLTTSVSDPEDGPLSPSDVTWTVLLHHGAHTHPRAVVTKDEIRPRYPSPEDLGAVHDSYLEVQARITDSDGATTSTSVDLLPLKVSLNFASRPTGARIVVAGQDFTTPTTITSWAGWLLNVSVPDQVLGGRPHTCTRWSDGGTCTRILKTGGTARTLTATFAPQ